MFFRFFIETYHFFFFLLLTLLLLFWFRHWSYKCTHWANYKCTYRYVLWKVGWIYPLFLFLLLTLLLFFWFSHWSYQCTNCASYKCTYRYVLQKVGWNYSLFFFYCSLCYYSSDLATGATNAPTLSITIAPTGMFFGRLVEFIHFFCFFCSLCCYSSGLATATNAPTVSATIAPTGMFFRFFIETYHFFFFLLLTLLQFFWFRHWSYKCTYWASYNCTYRYVFEKVGWDLPLFLSSSAHFAAILLI